MRFLFDRPCVAPLTHDEDDEDDTSLVGTTNVSYFKFPHSRLLCLSVLKLDGSLFDVYVGRNATVEELKWAIEQVFVLSPEEDQARISWTHVWGHFCLSYKGQKLVNDKARIRKYKIDDGDQLEFVRHMSIDFLHSKKHSKPQRLTWKQYPLLTLGPDAQEEKGHSNPSLANKENIEIQQDSNKVNEYQLVKGTPASEFKLTNYLKGWLSSSYSRLWGGSGKSSEGMKTTRPSRFSLNCFAGSSRFTEQS